MQNAVISARSEGDSLGGIIECLITGIPAGFGSPDFGENAEGVLAQYLFSVPAVKGLEFGAGFEMARMRGSQANDAFYTDDRGSVLTRTNHNGGINGGITNGMPLVFSVVIKPTPSIACEQDTVDLRTGESVKIRVGGRHDPCILPRAVPVIEAAAALASLELMS